MNQFPHVTKTEDVWKQYDKVFPKWLREQVCYMYRTLQKEKLSLIKLQLL